MTTSPLLQLIASQFRRASSPLLSLVKLAFSPIQSLVDGAFSPIPSLVERAFSLIQLLTRRFYSLERCVFFPILQRVPIFVILSIIFFTIQQALQPIKRLSNFLALLSGLQLKYVEPRLK